MASVSWTLLKDVTTASSMILLSAPVILPASGSSKGYGDTDDEALHAICLGRTDNQRDSQEGGNEGSKGKHGKLLVQSVARKIVCSLNDPRNSKSTSSHTLQQVMYAWLFR
eukprot:CAMPEP_0202499074 /NCGR_PEP_ID=MMETSP1361-20130828/28593_1 /ASSEMBLY_ACC=CAM_ASM_000849 /TAXON_ID=210615 /ORGANISM="Staurosira complex sp., Strain CCMP2646" /LENGTH=110 /DNA_ID=CAMNT_0049131163 /DNA_START=169 /DNA_END=501 /DNA_ORIENTATION=+